MWIDELVTTTCRTSQNTSAKYISAIIRLRRLSTWRCPPRLASRGGIGGSSHPGGLGSWPFAMVVLKLAFSGKAGEHPEHGGQREIERGQGEPDPPEDDQGQERVQDIGGEGRLRPRPRLEHVAGHPEGLGKAPVSLGPSEKLPQSG